MGFSEFIRERQFLSNVSPSTLEWYKHSFKWLDTDSSFKFPAISRQFQILGNADALPIGTLHFGASHAPQTTRLSVQRNYLSFHALDLSCG